MASTDDLNQTALPGQLGTSEDVFVFPASFSQQRLWFLDKLEPGQNTYNVPFTIHLTGALNLEVLEQAIRELVARHEVLRTTFSEDDSGKPIQLVASRQEFSLPVSDLRSLPSELRQEEAQKRVTAHINSPFDLKQAPLFRSCLLILSDTEYVFSLVFHHMIVDGWSLGVFLRELSALYESFALGKASPLPPLPIQYGDYATWQQDWLQGERLEELLAYWKKRLGDAPPVLELPTDYLRPAVQTFVGAQESVSLAPAVHEALTALGREEGATLFMTILAAFNLLLARYSGQEDIVVGTPISGRTRAELEGLIGFLVNTLPLRTNLSGNPTLRELLARIRAASLQDYAHQDLPFERVVEELSPVRDLSRSPIVQVFYFFENSVDKRQSHMADLKVSPFRGGERNTAKFDLSFSALVNSEGLRLVLTYNVDLFQSSTVRRMLGHLQTIFQALVANPDQRIGELSLLDERERHQLVSSFNDTATTYSRDLCLQQLFEQQVARTPEAIALEFRDQKLSYRELNERANQLAHCLIGFGVKADSRVGICVHRSPEMLIGLLGIMKAGGAYVPIDPAYPRDRIEFMLQDGGASVLVTESTLLETISTQDAKVVCFDRDADLLSQQSADNPNSTVSPANLSYVIFTSGSTGRPKGVQLEHHNVANFIGHVQRTFQVGERDVYLGVASMSFDASVVDFYLPLSVGARLVIVDADTTRDASALADTMSRTGVTVMHATPSTWRSLVDAGWRGNSAFTVLSGGEALSWDLAEELLPRCTALWNLYGPTETAVYSAIHKVSASDGTVLVGRPISNTQIYVLDKYGQLAPMGVPGEICIAGEGVARGYLDRPELSAEKFVADPFSGGAARMYRTGDLGRVRTDGILQCLGRLDHQIKLRGFRIELGEIESVIAEHEAVQQCTVLVRQDTPGNQQLVAYIVAPRRDPDLGPQLRRLLSQRLPNYMVPSAFVILDAFPLTPNGKLDRRALPAPDFTGAGLLVEASNEIERLLVSIWKGLLGLDAVGVTNSFFELGGHSLLATRMVSRIRSAFGVELPLRLLFEHPTISELAQDIDRVRPVAEKDAAPRLERQPRKNEIEVDGEVVSVFPTSFAEQRLWMLDRLQPNSSVYNIPIALRLKGELQVGALKQSLEEILRRHEVLRARFRLQGSGPVQCIGPACPVSLGTTDVSGQENPELVARKLVRQGSQHPFDLAHGPLIRASLLKLAMDDHVLLITVHHIVFDGWSGGVLLREFGAHYAAFATGTTPRLPELDIQYTDFAVWQREYLSGERLERQLNYWKQQLAGAPTYIDLPTDHPRPEMQTFNGSAFHQILPPELTAEVKRLTQKNEVTLFMTLLGAFTMLLARYSGQDDVVIGSPIAGRTRAETENLIGFFVNTIPLRTSVSGNPTFKQLLAQIRETTLDAYAYQDLPFEKLVEELNPERDISRNPIFQVAFALQNLPHETAELPGLTVTPYRAGSGGNSKFDLSLIASEVADSIVVKFEYNTDLFEAETIERMAGSFRALLAAVAEDPDRPVSDLHFVKDPLQAVPRTKPLQASLAQQRLWLLDRLDPHNPLHNVPLVLRLKGSLKIPALRNALNRIVARHESLRAWFMSKGAAIPLQMITPSLEVDLVMTSVTGVPEGVREIEARRVVLEEIHCPFDLGTGPLIRVRLIKISDVDHVLVVNTHQIICDAWSLKILRNELVEFYAQEVSGEVRQPAALPVQYADYAAWQRHLLSGGTLHRHLRYWKQKLAGAPASLDLPTDRPHPSVQNFRGASFSFEVSRDLTEKLRELAHRERATLFMTLLASFDILLSRYTGQDDIVVGSLSSGRLRPEVEKLIGSFVNTLVLRTSVDSCESFRQLLTKVRETTVDAYAHQDLPFEKLLEKLNPGRDLSRNPVIQVVFALQNLPRETIELPGLEVAPFSGGSAVNSKFDLSLIALEHGESITATFEYDTTLFDGDRIERMQQHWLTLLEGIVANPDCPVGDLSLLEEEESKQALHKWNPSQTYPVDVCIHRRFEEQVKHTPASIAVSFEGQHLSYSELNARANQLARYLMRLGVGPDSLVGLCVERSLDMVVAILAIVKAGGAYLPLDPRYPKDRLAFMVEDAKPAVVLTQRELRDSIPETPGRLFVLDADWGEVADEDPSDLASAVRPDNLAYVIYTSGSTGRPKGCQITHANVVRLFNATYDWYRFDERDVWTMFHSYAFDFSVWELWGALIYGGRLVVVPYLVSRSPEEFYRLLIVEKVTVLNQTPSSFQQLMQIEENSGTSAELSLRYVVFGGEALDLPSLRPWFERHGDRTPQLVNMYGITETTVHVTYRPLAMADTAAGSVIGCPIPDLQVYLLDSRRQPVPVGVPGEIYVGGAGVARGYLNRPELNAERFIADPFRPGAGRVLYKSGDQARRLSNGDLEYLGRIDQQVKIRGFRIELGEIETSLAKHPAVRQALVLVREDSPGDKRLVGYVVPKPSQKINITEIRDELRRNLPDYMVPAALVELESLPLTPNGKVDRKALPQPDMSSHPTGKAAPPRDKLEESLLGIWQRVLQSSNMGITDNFFDLGGHSIMAAQLVSEMEKIFARKIPLAALFRGATVEEMARVLREGSEGQADPIVMRLQKGRTTPFFAVVGPGLDSIGYKALAQAMGPEQTFYKLQAHRLVRPDAPITLDDMRSIARDYVAAMQAVQPHGPYFLGGMCAGTHIGEQMVMQLEAAGEKVALFAIFDTWVRQNSQVRWKWVVYYYLQRFRGLMRLSRKRQLKMIREALAKKLRRVATLSPPVETSWSKLYWPGKEFKIPRFQAPVALFKRPRQPFYYVKDEAMGWRERSQGGVHIYRIDFPHRMLRDPYVRELASRLLESLPRTAPAAVERLQVWPSVSEHPSPVDSEV